MKYSAEDIVNNHPLVFKTIKHIETMDGWNGLVYKACSIIETYLQHLPAEKNDEDLPLCASQIKSKFGGLRFYMSQYNEYIQGVIDMAEAISLVTCEFCGENAKSYNINGWIFTLCKKHHEEKLNESNKIKNY